MEPDGSRSNNGIYTSVPDDSARKNLLETERSKLKELLTKMRCQIDSYGKSRDPRFQKIMQDSEDALHKIERKSVDRDSCGSA